jgi:hypothetical protein
MRVEDAGKASAHAFEKSHQVLDATRKDVADIEEFIASMSTSNGSPTLGDSSPAPGQSDEPAASWSGAKQA